MNTLTSLKSSQLESMTKAPFFLAFISAALLYWGWLQRDEYWIRAEEGIGYALGITGAVMMLLLLLYPLSKKSRLLRSIIATRLWFRGHMILGVAGPLMILFHCNFALGSTNSNIALFSMLLVVLSGLVGRYLYRHIHNGLYGQKLNFFDLQNQQLQFKSELEKTRLGSEVVLPLLGEIENLADKSGLSLIGNYKNTRLTKQKSRNLYRQLKKIQLNDENKYLVEALKNNVKSQILLLRSMTGLALYTRLFSIWHVVHLPFFFMLIITAIVHIIVVHMY